MKREIKAFYKKSRKKVKNIVLEQVRSAHIRLAPENEKKMLLEDKERKEWEQSYLTLAKEKKQKITENKEELQNELDQIRTWLSGFDKDHVWAFNSGNSGQDFRGNPKYLFAYVNYYRPDIRAYWICRTEETIEQVRSLGFCGLLLNSPAAAYAISRTGVAVNEQVRALIPFADDTKYLNLWHGNGFKTCERARIEDGDDMRLGLAAKYIKCNSFYQNNMIVCCVNPLQEQYLLRYMGVPARNMLHAGYARSTYQQKYKLLKTFDHNILGEKGLGEDTKLAVYAPTFRAERGNTFSEAVPDLERLYQCCERNHILLIFKMHPLMENDGDFINAKAKFGNRPYFLFWDNRNDIYEIINRMDLLIYDYSSIFNDFLLGGVKNYIRYIYDSENMMEAACVNNEEEYYKFTYGTVCRSFDELLPAIDHFEEESSDPEAVKNILKQQWEFSTDDDFEKTIQFVMDFEVGQETYPTLYSFDIFDTLISRKGLAPESIFYAVRKQMRSAGIFDIDFVERYPHIRSFIELSLREYMNKTQEQRHSFYTEIKFEQIFNRIQSVYGLSLEQVNLLKKWELEEELAAVIPLRKQIDYVKKLLADGEKVILISDMYLPKDVIVQMLKKADPVLEDIPFFLSNEYGVLKSNRLLFFEVYRSFKPYYNFGKWIHTGDNINSDQNQPRKLCINTRLIKKPEFSSIETDMTKFFDNYDGYKIAALQSRMCQEFCFGRSEFVIDYVAPLMVSYVDWALRDAIEKGFQTLYFVSRDGHPLKRIADVLIKEHGWPLKTKYIYASRRVWRVPSYIDEIDEEFWATYGGNFNDIHSKKAFLRAAGIEDENTFNKLLPQIDLEGVDFDDWSNGQPARKLAKILRSSEAYCKYLLNYAAELRTLTCGYLKQEIDPSEKHAFVEFWGRGYNQLCHSRLWNFVLGHEEPLYYYYARSLFPTEGNCIRYNITNNNAPMFYIETLFANMPYHSIDEYEIRDGRIEPVIKPISNDEELFQAMEQLMPEYARRYAALDLDDPVWNDRKLFDFLLSYCNENKMNPFIYENFGSLTDAVAMYGRKQEFARPYTEEDIENFINKVPRSRGTMSITMSYYRSKPEVKRRYDEIYQIEPGDDVAVNPLLNPQQMEKNRNNKALLEKAVAQADELKLRYAEACAENSVENLVTFLSVTKGIGDIYYSLRKLISKQNQFKVEECTKQDIKDIPKLADLLSRSKFVLVKGNIPQLSGLYFRTETKCILLSSSAFDIYRQGYIAPYIPVWEKRYSKFLWNTRFSVIDMPADSLKINTLSKYGIDPAIVEEIPGAAITDIYFDPEYHENARKKMQELFPETENKKIILYMPSLRNCSDNSYWYEMLDMERMKELLGDEYVVVVDTRNKKELMKNCYNIVEIPGFSKLINSKISLREMVTVSDIIVGDYRDTLFECVLLKKPVFSTGFDFEKKIKDINVIYELLEDNPYPIIRTAEELAREIRNLDKYDYEPLQVFKGRYLKYCDGHTADRIFDYMQKCFVMPES